MIDSNEVTGINMFAQMLADLAKQLQEADKQDDRVEATVQLLVSSELLDHADATKLANLV
jgi:hypothetical protein